MLLKGFKFNAISLLFISASLVSCDNSEFEISDQESPTDCIILNIQSPENLTPTRASDGYKLRYVAKIFQGGSSKVWGQPLQRQEITEGEANNQMVFKVPADNNYAIMVFADYIPASYTADANGLYKDYFYDTTSEAKRCTLRTTPGSNSDAVSPDFFNNPYYDAFFGIDVFYKEEAEKRVDMTLGRTTAKVIFEDNSPNTGIAAVTVNKLGVLRYFDMDVQTITTLGSSEANKNRGDISLHDHATLTESNKELFYFYTLADQTTSSSNQWVATEFKVTGNSTTTAAISAMKIPVKANHRTIVKGSYMPEDPSATQPGGGDSSKAGDIILTVSTNYDWEQEELTY